MKGTLQDSTMRPKPITVGTPLGAVADPFGKFVYVTNGNSVVPLTNGNTVSAYSIDANTGALVPVPGSPFARLGSQSGVPTVDPSGRFLYVPNFGAFNVSAYSIDPTTGGLAPITGSPFATRSTPFSITADLSGKFMYVASQGDGVSAYTIDTATGALTPVTGSPFAAGSAPISVTTTGKIQLP